MAVLYPADAGATRRLRRLEHRADGKGIPADGERAEPEREVQAIVGCS